MKDTKLETGNINTNNTSHSPRVKSKYTLCILITKVGLGYQRYFFNSSFLFFFHKFVKKERKKERKKEEEEEEREEEEETKKERRNKERKKKKMIIFKCTFYIYGIILFWKRMINNEIVIT
jgi:uncharacterized ion transporter superfamily protein YfcC